MAKRLRQASAKRPLDSSTLSGPSRKMAYYMGEHTKVYSPMCDCMTMASISCLVCKRWFCRWHYYNDHPCRALVKFELPELLPPRVNGAVVRKFWRPKEFVRGD